MNYARMHIYSDSVKKYVYNVVHIGDEMYRFAKSNYSEI